VLDVGAGVQQQQYDVGKTLLGSVQQRRPVVLTMYNSALYAMKPDRERKRKSISYHRTNQ